MTWREIDLPELCGLVENRVALALSLLMTGQADYALQEIRKAIVDLRDIEARMEAEV